MRWSLVLAVAGLSALMLAAGCATTSTCSPCGDEDAVLADYTTTTGVTLPPGFRPLDGQFDPDNPDDHYNGWPRYIVCEADGMIMAYVPSQTFYMGGGRAADEVPGRQVVVNHFYIDIHEVTNAQFSRCGRGSGQFKAYWQPGYSDAHPVRNVSWDEAMDYALQTGRVLPTEAQWEAAARGDDLRLYPWGNDEASDVTRYLCNARTNRADYDGYEGTAPAMNFAAGVSPYGAFNMAGNVWEWCRDWYDPGRYAYPSDEDPATSLDRGPRAFGDANYPNPMGKELRASRIGPGIGTQRVIRGGSFADPIQRCRVDSRDAAAPGVRRGNIGFRCVLPLSSEMHTPEG